MDESHVRERRWVVVAEDGRFVTLGRHSDPIEAEIRVCGQQLCTQGLGGWLAVMEGIYYGKAAITMMMVRELAPPISGGSWEVAEAKLHDERRRTLDNRP